jgi:hypothetical protein
LLFIVTFFCGVSWVIWNQTRLNHLTFTQLSDLFALEFGLGQPLALRHELRFLVKLNLFQCLFGCFFRCNLI